MAVQCETKAKLASFASLFTNHSLSVISPGRLCDSVPQAQKQAVSTNDRCGLLGDKAMFNPGKVPVSNHTVLTGVFKTGASPGLQIMKVCKLETFMLKKMPPNRVS